MDTTADEPGDVPYFAMRYQLTLSAEVLRGWAESMDQARHLAAECIQSDTFRDLVINGISPDGTVDWPAAGIVRALREAANELAVDGWTPVAAAGR